MEAALEDDLERVFSTSRDDTYEVEVVSLHGSQWITVAATDDIYETLKRELGVIGFFQVSLGGYSVDRGTSFEENSMEENARLTVQQQNTRDFDPTRVEILEGHTGSVHHVAEMSKDHLVTAAFDKTVRIWNRTSEVETLSIKNQVQSVSCPK